MGRRAKIRCISYGFALLTVLLTAVAACHVGAGNYVIRMDAQLTRCFGEALSAVERLDASLRKCAFASGSSMESAICTQIYSDAQCAETALSSLPIQMDALEKISKQISVMGDYALALSKSAAEGVSFSAEDRDNLSKYSDITKELYEQLGTLRVAYEDHTLIHEQRLRLVDSLNNLEEESSSKTETLDAAFHRLQETIPEHASMIYDGQFSDDFSGQESYLQEANRVTESEAMAAAATFLKVDIEDLHPLEPSEGAVPCWRFSVFEDEKSIVAVTVNGGNVIRYLSSKDGCDTGSDRDACIEAGKTFLESHGFPEMVEDETAEKRAENMICFVPVQDGVLCYPDRIAMRICPDSGEVTAFDASDYYRFHHDRNLPFLDLDSLRSALPEDASVEQERPVLLLSPGGKECLCAEFYCSLENGDSAHIYVNAQSGQQQLIQLEK